MKNIFTKTVVGTLVFTVIATASIVAQADTGKSTAAPTLVEVTHPSRGGVDRVVTLPGTIHALQEATLYAKVPGYLKAIKVDKGDSVKSGALIAEIEAPELSADLTRYRAEATAAKAEYDRLQQAYQRSPDLVMPVELDRAKGKFDVAQANVDRNQTLLAYANITAPFPGVITKRYVDLGAFIPAATSGSTAQSAAIVTLMNFTSVRAQVAVPAAEASLVNKGLPVRLNVEGLAGRNFAGTITRYAYALDDGSRTMLAEVELPNPKLELRPGMYASMQIGIEHHDAVLLIPVAALVMEKANAFAFVAADGVAKKRPVKVGFNDGVKVEVMEGITANDAVILVGKRTLSDGQAVQIAETK